MSLQSYLLNEITSYILLVLNLRDQDDWIVGRLHSSDHVTLLLIPLLFLLNTLGHLVNVGLVDVIVLFFTTMIRSQSFLDQHQRTTQLFKGLWTLLALFVSLLEWFTKRLEVNQSYDIN